jgi:hypothetical protein
MTTPSSVLALARADLGYEESPPDSNRSKFGAWYGMDGAPWCAMAVSCWFYAAGLPLAFTTPKGFSYCPFGIDGFRARGELVPVAQAQPGDVVFFDWNGDKVADHVGIVVSGGLVLTTIEGNTTSGDAGDQSNGGGVFQRQRAASLVLAVGRPAWSSAPTPAPPGPAPSSPPWPGRVLALTTPNMTGNDVRTYQGQMAKRGWKLGVDGVFGPQSHDVTIAFQREKGLTRDGQVGPVTWRAAWTDPIT